MFVQMTALASRYLLILVAVALQPNRTAVGKLAVQQF